MQTKQSTVQNKLGRKQHKRLVTNSKKLRDDESN